MKKTHTKTHYKYCRQHHRQGPSRSLRCLHPSSHPRCLALFRNKRHMCNKVSTANWQICQDTLISLSLSLCLSLSLSLCVSAAPHPPPSTPILPSFRPVERVKLFSHLSHMVIYKISIDCFCFLLQYHDASLRLVLNTDSWHQIQSYMFSGTDEMIQMVKKFLQKSLKKPKKQLLIQTNGVF